MDVILRRYLLRRFEAFDGLHCHVHLKLGTVVSS